MITEFSPVQYGSVLYYADPALSGGDPSLLHGFATRRGGVSTEEHLKEMNLGFFRGEARALTEENYARFASAVGIPAEHLDKITEPFYMEDKSRARRQGGAGLGLALCKRIADLHGTRLTFDSQAGRGTTVTLCLSVVGEAEEKGGGAV